MFSFIFKMFSDGSATLPAGGMIAVSQQLIDKAESLGVSILTSTPVSRITKKGDGYFLVECQKKVFESSSVVVATDGQIAKNIISNVKGFESLKGVTDQPQLSVGCLYYSFLGKAPVEEPILGKKKKKIAIVGGKLLLYTYIYIWVYQSVIVQFFEHGV